MSETTGKITTQMRKGILEYAILLVIAKGDAYASDILGVLTSQRLIVVEGTLYPLLSRMKTDGFVSYTWVESQNGPPRKYYRLTGSWQELLILMERIWRDLSSAVEGIRSL